MKFLSVRDLRNKSGDVWRDLPDEHEMVVTNNGRPVAILASVDEAEYPPPVALVSDLPNPDHGVFLEVALGGRVGCLVAGNLRHFPAKSRSGMTAVSPSEFLRLHNQRNA